MGAASSAHAVQAVLNPQSVKPGDAFLIKVSGVRDIAPPPVSFRGISIPFTSCGDGCFVAVGAVDLKTRPGRYPVSVAADGRKLHLAVRVVPARFRKVQLSLPEEKVTLSPEDLERAKREQKRLNDIWLVRSERMWDGAFALPVATEVSTPFGTTRIINRKKESIHGGIDMRGRQGDDVRASQRGRVVLADGLFFGGNTLVIDHGSGIYSVYMHLSGFAVSEGDLVDAGTVIGAVGSTGRSTGPHLHFGVKVLGMNVDPLSMVRLDLR